MFEIWLVFMSREGKSGSFDGDLLFLASREQRLNECDTAERKLVFFMLFVRVCVYVCVYTLYAVESE